MKTSRACCILVGILVLHEQVFQDSKIVVFGSRIIEYNVNGVLNNGDVVLSADEETGGSVGVGSIVDTQNG